MKSEKYGDPSIPTFMTYEDDSPIDQEEYLLCPFDFLRLFLTCFLLRAALNRLVLPCCLIFVPFLNLYRSNTLLPVTPEIEHDH
jgi:hypothetical protein